MHTESQIKTEKSIQKSILNQVADFIITKRSLSLLATILILSLFFACSFPKTFGTYENLSKMLLNVSTQVIIVIAMSLLLISGEIDLSLGANMALSGIFCGYLLKIVGMDIPWAILLTILLAVVMGLINGLIIARIGVNSFIATLAMGKIYLGLAVWLAGPGFTDFPKSFNALAQNLLFMLQLPIWYSLVVVVSFAYLLSNTRFFRQYYYVGGNMKAAVLSGINIKNVKVIAYVVAACLASLAGIISAARFGSSMTNIGGNVELMAITAAVIGGVSFTGGVGAMSGAALGAIFIALLNNGLIIASIDPYWQPVVVGVVLVFAIIADVLLNKRKAH